MSPLSPQHSSPQRSALTWVTALLLVWTPQSHLLLRSLDWIEDYGAHVGGSVFLDMPEMGVVGEAQVLVIDPCPPLEPSEGRLVTATFRHEGGTAWDLKLESESEPIGVTALHPIWSVDREAWVSAVELEQGERVKTLEGTSIVEGIEQRQEPETVFNIEVDGDHVYRVGESGVLVHNSSVQLELPFPDDDDPEPDDNDGDVVVLATFTMQNQSFQDVNETAREVLDSGDTLPGLRGPNRDREDMHAEIGAMLQAYDAGLRGGHGDLVITGMIACSYCRGDVKTMARHLGLCSLTVNNNGTTISFPTPQDLEPIRDGGMGWT